MNPAAIPQHPHHAIVPSTIAGFVGRGGVGHHMDAVDPDGVNYAPMHHFLPPVISNQMHPITSKYRVVVLGAGPLGVTFLLKLLEEIHQKSKTHRIDCKILLIEQRDNFKYPDDRSVDTVIRGVKATRKDVWEEVNTAIWPQCFKQQRFRNTKGEGKTFQDALQSQVDYTVLRADLLTALGQMCHAVFGNHDSFHFIPNTRIDQSTLPNLEKSVQNCIAKNDIQDFPLSRGTQIILSMGWRERGAGHLIPGNVWTPLTGESVSLSMNLVIKSVPPRLSMAQLAMHNFQRTASRLDDLVEDGHHSTAMVIAKDQNAAVEMHITDPSYIQAVLHHDKTEIHFRELPSALATLFLRQIAVQMLDDKLALATGEYEDLGDHSLKVQTDKGTGFWSKAHTRTANGSLVILLGSARIAFSAHLIPHLTSASVFGEIASHSSIDLRRGLDGILSDFESYSALSVQYMLQDYPWTRYSSDVYLKQHVVPSLLFKLSAERSSLRKQVEALQVSKGGHILRIPQLTGWTESVEKAMQEIFKALLENAETRKESGTWPTEWTASMSSRTVESDPNK